MPPLVSAKAPVPFEISPPFNVLPSTPNLSEPAVFKCFLCPIYYKQGEWDAHEKAAHYFQCAACDETFTSDNELSNHIKSSHDVSSLPVPPDQILQCATCDKTCSTKDDLRDHMKSSHEKTSIQPPLDQIPTSDFNIPDVISKNSTAVNANSRPAVRKPTEENKPILQCGQCDFTANLNRAIKTHMMKNHSVPPASPFSCDMCDYRTTENASLTLHLLDAHMKRTPEISVDKLQSFHCEICTFTALKESTLRDHIKAKHEPPPVQPISLQCELCPYVAPLKINMRRHIAATHAKI